MGCQHGKASHPTAPAAKLGSEDIVKSLLLLGNEAKSAAIADPRLVAQGMVKSSDEQPKLSDEQPISEDHAAEQYDFFASTSPEPESERAPAVEVVSANTGQLSAAATSSLLVTPHSHAHEEDSTIYGDWGEATISGTTLTFKSTGNTVALELIHSKEFQMTHEGNILRAVLAEDGKLHWSHGDVWSRVSKEATALPSNACETKEHDNVWSREYMEAEAKRNAALQNHPHAQQLLFPHAAVNMAEHVSNAGGTADMQRKAEVANVKGEVATEEKTVRKERQTCCC